MSRWQRPQQELTPFRLVDLDGKVWSSEKLQGHSLIVGVWATWSAPCVWMLPKLEHLHKRLRGRPDVRLLTINVDEDPAFVRQWMQDKGFTFPVLNGKVYVGQLLGFLSVPRVWVVDAAGIWKWEQIGYDLDAEDWEAEVLERIDGTRTAGA